MRIEEEIQSICENCQNVKEDTTIYVCNILYPFKLSLKERDS
jgi:hypothetical protein